MSRKSRRIRRKRRREFFDKLKRGLFWKLMLLAIELFGMYHINLSYRLAKQGMDTCSDISSQIILYLVAPFITCIISKTIENVFEHNKLSFSEPIANINGGIDDGLDN